MGKCLFMRKGETHTKPGQRLPYGYMELTYIESTGTQYVDTGFKPNQNTEIQLDVAFLGSVGSNIAGVRNSNSDATNRFGIITFSSASKIGAFFRDSAIQAISFDANRHSYKLKKSGLELDGTSYGSANGGSFSCTYNIALFGWNNGSDGIAATSSRVYACKIYDNGTLVRDFVPCINASGEIGLYDSVGKKFYGNAGTGVFTGSEVA